MTEERKRQYFAELAPNYAGLTSNITQDIFAKFFESYNDKLHLTSASTIHDNASGPGTATQILVQHAANTGITPTILATDYAPGMIETLRTLQATESPLNPAWSNVTTQVLDSSDLSTIPDSTFTHSISNFSLFTITNAVQSLHEIHRTLVPGGIVVVLVWKRFTIQHMLAAAQDHVKGPGYAAEHAVPVNGPQYFERDTVRNQLVEAGFDAGGIETWSVDHVVSEGGQGEGKWEGMYKFMTTTSVSAGSTRGWSATELGKWGDAVRWAMEKEAKKGGEGGVKFEGWVNVVRK